MASRWVCEGLACEGPKGKEGNQGITAFEGEKTPSPGTGVLAKRLQAQARAVVQEMLGTPCAGWMQQG